MNRKRSGSRYSSAERNDAKRARLSSASNNGCEQLPEPVRKKKKRCRTTGLRKQLVSEIEVLLQKDPCPAGHLFTTLNDDGVPCAPLRQLIPFLNVDLLKVTSLSSNALLRMSNLTSMFTIEKSDNSGDLVVAYKVCGPSAEDRTVFLDNLPHGCTEQKLGRLLAKFGTVVEIRIPKGRRPPIFSKDGTKIMDKNTRSCAFVQFTDVNSVKSILDSYGRKDGNYAPRKRPLCIIQLKSRIKRLGLRGRKRNQNETILLVQLRRRFRLLLTKERKQRRKVGRIIAANRRQTQTAESSKLNGSTRDDNDATLDVSDVDQPAKGENKNAIKKKLPKKKRSSLSNLPKTGMKSARRRRRNFRRIRNITHPSFIRGSVKSYFAGVVALSLAKYKQLKKDYLKLRQEAHNDLQSSLRKRNISINGDRPSKTVETMRDQLWNLSNGSEELER